MYEVVETKTIFEGKIVTLQIDEVVIENNQKVKREVVKHAQAACVFAYDKDGGYLVEQYRHPMKETVLEAVAGICEKDEDPAETAKRELKEEINALCEQLHYFGAIYPSPGFCNEIIHLYSAEISGYEQGTPDEDEFITIKKFPLTQIYEMVDKGQIKDAKTIALLLKFKNAHNSQF